MDKSREEKASSVTIGISVHCIYQKKIAGVGEKIRRIGKDVKICFIGIKLVFQEGNIYLEEHWKCYLLFEKGQLKIYYLETIKMAQY